MKTVNEVVPQYAEMVPECRKWSIGRTRAFALAKLGILDTFVDGRKRYVMLESLVDLPNRLKTINGGAK